MKDFQQNPSNNNEILTSHRPNDKCPGPLRATNHADYSEPPANHLTKNIIKRLEQEIMSSLCYNL